MSIERVIKSYAVFLLVLGSLGSVGQWPSAQDFMANTFNIDLNPPAKKVEAQVKIATDKSMNFNISNNPETAFGAVGSENNKVIELSFLSYDSDIVVEGLTLKVEGVKAENLRNVQLKSGEEVVSEGEVVGDNIKFQKFRYSLTQGASGKLDLVLTVGKNSRIGDRFRLLIEKPEDLSIKMGDEVYFVRDLYPIKSPYFSILNARK